MFVCVFVLFVCSFSFFVFVFLLVCFLCLFFFEWRFSVGARAGILGVFLFLCTCVLCAMDDEVEKALLKLP